MLTPAVWTILILVLGLIVGSFFNVAIHRWPKEDKKEHDWIFTPSHCPKCGAKIRWYDNIPVLSWLLLGARCRSCRAPIHWRYPLVELGTALLWVITARLVWSHGLSGVAPANITGWHVFFAIWIASFCLLTVVIDGQTGLIPDEITIANFIGAWAFVFVCAPHTISSGWLDSLIGMFALALPFLLFWYFGWMGMGDVLYVLGLGAFLGWKLILTCGMLSVAIGGILGLFIIIGLMALKKYKPGVQIPFGPFLALSAYICMFWGNDLLGWYLNLILHRGGNPAPALSGLLFGA